MVQKAVQIVLEENKSFVPVFWTAKNGTRMENHQEAVLPALAGPASNCQFEGR